MYESDLKELGLTDNETKIYLVLLQEGILNPTKLAEKTGLHRSYIYDTLERLLEKGVINTILINNKKHYQPIDPNILREIFELKLKKLDMIIPQLIGLFNSTKEETRIELHKGKRVYRTLIKYLLSNIQENDVIHILGLNEKISDSVEPIYLKQYFNIIKEKNVKEKIIIPRGTIKVLNSQIIYKELDPKYLDDTTIVIHKSKVFLFIWGNPYYLIVLESSKVADTYKKQFELLWSIAK